MRILLPVPLMPDVWIGGVNYFLSLVSALRNRTPDTVEITVLSNLPATFGESNFGGVRVMDAPWLGSSSRWIDRANRLCATTTSVDLRLQLVARQTKADLISHSAPQRMAPCPMLFWMPDFQHRHYPEFFSATERRSRDIKVTSTLRCGHILVSSESAAADFRRFYPELSGVQTHVLPFAPLLELPSTQTMESVHLRYGLRDDFFLLPNQYWRHKNHKIVIEALRLLPESFQVVCTGAITDFRGDGHIREMMESIDRYGLSDRFRMLGVLPRSDVATLMSASRAVINPSLFEGWSTTVEEGKAYGKRLILSNIAVHREQDPVESIYFDPSDAEALASAMRQVQTEHCPDSEARRALEARDRYRRDVARFSRRYLEVAKSVVASVVM